MLLYSSKNSEKNLVLDFKQWLLALVKMKVQSLYFLYTVDIPCSAVTTHHAHNTEVSTQAVSQNNKYTYGDANLETELCRAHGLQSSVSVNFLSYRVQFLIFKRTMRLVLTDS